ncbi:hypothetical protein HYN46_03320 [Aquirhabdus parva]|uniref:SH3 domain protein n=2 Tax=Aquirhabdus parva TaxID=2283318 RepID=A0A345P3X2_9GAMM|nr:hypothetical protein [Aquirhabdus parva]AXI01981.1 hypothetical protein HYN46_03320 [Aquirhabdus parva]
MITSPYSKRAAVLVAFMMFFMSTWAIAEVPASGVAATPATNGASSVAATVKPTAPKPPTLETQLANLSKQSSSQASRLNQLEIANRDALTRNQTLQLENDNLTVQVKVLQSDRGAQMFIYGAVAILIGALIGYFCASYFMRRSRRW